VCVCVMRVIGTMYTHYYASIFYLYSVIPMPLLLVLIQVFFYHLSLVAPCALEGFSCLIFSYKELGPRGVLFRGFS